MEQKERMDQGLIYDPADNRISTEQTSCLDAQYEFNATHPSEMKKRAALLKQMLGAIGENCYIEPPFRANWGGKHVYMGNNVYANFNLTVVDIEYRCHTNRTFQSFQGISYLGCHIS